MQKLRVRHIALDSTSMWKYFPGPKSCKKLRIISFWFPVLMAQEWPRAPFNMEFREFLLPTAYELLLLFLFYFSE